MFKKPWKLALAASLVSSFAFGLPAATANAQGTRTTMIVMLKTPNAPTSPKVARALRSEVAQVRAFVTAGGAKILSSTLVPATITATLTNAQAAALRTNPNVALVVANGVVYGAKVAKSPNVIVHKSDTTNGVVANNALCGTASAPQLNPEAVSTVNAPAAWSAGATGAGVSVAFMAEGIDTTVLDLQRNSAYASSGSAAGSPVITAQPDFSGDGSNAPTTGGEAFLDASSIGAQGNTVFDLYNYLDAINNPGCDITVTGTAPGSTITSLKVFGQTNATTNSGFVEAIQYAITHGIKVLNESFGSNPMGDSTVDAVKLANDAAVAAGVTVVVSSGDAGATNTIGSPASDPNVIAVGASTTFRDYAQNNFGGFNAPNLGSGSWINNNISSLSSAGIAQNGRTIDLVAPGDLNWALCTTNPNFSDCAGSDLMSSGGTSESAPLTAGAAADVIQAYASTHNGSLPTPAVIKAILMSSATEINAPVTEQGAGLLNIGKAVALAKAYKVAKPSASGALLASTTALNLTGQPLSTSASTVSLTNTSSAAKTVAFSARQLVATRNVAGQFNLDPSTTSTQPTFTYWSGASAVYQTKSFTVPAGVDRLEYTSSFLQSGQSSVLHVALFDPSGAFAGYSEPQGNAGYSRVEISEPAAGIWKAFFFTVSNNNSPTSKGTAGPVSWQAQYFKFATVAVTAKPLALKANTTATASVSVRLPANPGDYGVELLAKSGANTVVIPVTERVAISVVNNVGYFTSSVTGGNGRGGSPAQSNTFNVAIPKGVNNVEVDLELANAEAAGNLPGLQVSAALFNAQGTMVAYDTNVSVDELGNETFNPYVSLFAASPAAGQYQIELFFANPVVGNTLITAVHGQVYFNAVSITSSLPNATSTSVSSANGADATMTVTNNSFTPLLLSTDARGTQDTTLNLSDAFGASATQGLNKSWSYFVPTQSSALSVSLTGSLPSSFDISTWPGDPLVSPLVNAPGLVTSTSGNTSSLTYTPQGGLEAGFWYLEWNASQPALDTPVDPTATATASVSVTTKAFDDSILTSTGDLQESALGSGLNQGDGTLVMPGHTVTIDVMIAPTASVGSVVSGTVAIQQCSIAGFAGLTTIGGVVPFFSTVSYVPYKYTVGQ